MKKERRDKKLTRKFKDLNSKNKKKRKEPPKPWGVRERLIVLGILISTILISIILALPARDFKLSGLPRINFADFNIDDIFGEKTIEIGQSGHFNINDQKAQSAIKLFNQEIKPIAGLYGFLVIRLNDGSSYGVSDTEKFQGASLLKLPLLALLYKESEDGKINLDTRYILKNSDKVTGSGPLDNAKAGTVYTYRQLAELMAKDSDRTAYKIIKNILGDTTFNNFLETEGMTNTSITSGDTTPRDMGIILQNLNNGGIVNDKDKTEIFGFLTNTIYENWITAGVPKGVRVVHKFGEDVGVMTDAGIIFAKNPYIIVVMSNGITKSDADKVFPAVSKDIYNIETDQN